MSKTKHTEGKLIKLPVRAEYMWPDTFNGLTRYSMVDADDNEIFNLESNEKTEEGMIDFLVKVVNCHEELLAVCKAYSSKMGFVEFEKMCQSAIAKAEGDQDG